MMREWQVGIIGGGPGGLMTAYSLQKISNSLVRTTLFEASSRLGGKILSPHFQTHPVRYEAGAAEFYDYSQFDDDPLKELVTELGLPIRTMGGPSVIMRERVLANVDDLEDAFGPAARIAFVDFDRLAKDRITPQEFYHSDDPDGAVDDGERRRFDTLLTEVAAPATRAYVHNLIHSDLATEPAETSLKYGLQNYLMNDPAYMHLYGIEGGNDRLPRELAARIDANFLLEHPVRAVSKAPSGRLRVDSVHHNQPRQDEFDFVVVALPHNHLPAVTFAGERLSAAMREHFDYYNYPAHYLRITILFDRPFWTQAFQDSYWMLDHFGGCCLYDESSREPGSKHGVLGWLLGGSAALEMSRLSDQELIAAALDSLPQSLARGREFFVEGKIHRWQGAVNAMPGGLVPRAHDRRHQPEPAEHPNLFVVGDYLFDSTLNGVLDSAEYVAAWLAARMVDFKEDA